MVATESNITATGSWPVFLIGSRSEAAQGGVMAGVRNRGPRRRGRQYVAQPDRMNACQRAALGGHSNELVRNLG